MTWSDDHYGTTDMRYLIVVGKGWSSEGPYVQFASFPIEVQDADFSDSGNWHLWTEYDLIADRVPWQLDCFTDSSLPTCVLFLKD